jgi:3-oxoadipate CoA-transferase, beta subunit
MAINEEITGWSREQIAQKIAEDIPDGSYVNLGIGLPELVANYIPENREVIFHTENGLLGVGPSPPAGDEDDELINAGKKPVTAIKGACFFHHADSFAMIRGGHIDICVLGAFQISAKGDLANWSTGEPNAIPAVGGAMDLVQGVKTIYVITQHITKKGEPKIVEECTYPLTGKGVVSRIYTDYAVIDISSAGLTVREMAEGISPAFLQKHTGAPLHFNSI